MRLHEMKKLRTTFASILEPGSLTISSKNPFLMKLYTITISSSVNLNYRLITMKHYTFQGLLLSSIQEGYTGTSC